MWPDHVFGDLPGDRPVGRLPVVDLAVESTVDVAADLPVDLIVDVIAGTIGGPVPRDC